MRLDEKTLKINRYTIICIFTHFTFDKHLKHAVRSLYLGSGKIKKKLVACCFIPARLTHSRQSCNFEAVVSSGDGRVHCWLAPGRRLLRGDIKDDLRLTSEPQRHVDFNSDLGRGRLKWITNIEAELEHSCNKHPNDFMRSNTFLFLGVRLKWISVRLGSRFV